MGGPTCVTYFRGSWDVWQSVTEGGGSKLAKNSVMYFMDMTDIFVQMQKPGGCWRFLGIGLRKLFVSWFLKIQQMTPVHCRCCGSSTRPTGVTLTVFPVDCTIYRDETNAYSTWIASCALTETEHASSSTSRDCSNLSRSNVPLWSLSTKPGTWWRIVWVNSFQPEGHGFDSRSSRHVGTLGKFLSHNCLWRFRSAWISDTVYPCCVGRASE